MLMSVNPTRAHAEYSTTKGEEKLRDFSQMFQLMHTYRQKTVYQTFPNE